MGICPGNNERAGKRKSDRTCKGNVWVRRLLCEFAQAAARSSRALKDKFAALSIRKGHKKSIVALAHKLLRIIYAMLSDGTHYQDLTVDYEALVVQRNALDQDARQTRLPPRYRIIPPPSRFPFALALASCRVATRSLLVFFHVKRLPTKRYRWALTKVALVIAGKVSEVDKSPVCSDLRNRG